MGSKLSQYDYSILTLKCVNLIQEKTINDCHLVILSSCQNQNENRVKTFNKYIYLLILYWRVLTIPKRF